MGCWEHSNEELGFAEWGEFFEGWRNINFSRRTLLHAVSQSVAYCSNKQFIHTQPNVLPYYEQQLFNQQNQHHTVSTVHSLSVKWEVAALYIWFCALLLATASSWHRENQNFTVPCIIQGVCLLVKTAAIRAECLQQTATAHWPQTDQHHTSGHTQISFF